MKNDGEGEGRVIQMEIAIRQSWGLAESVPPGVQRHSFRLLTTPMTFPVLRSSPNIYF